MRDHGRFRAVSDSENISLLTKLGTNCSKRRFLWLLWNVLRGVRLLGNRVRLGLVQTRSSHVSHVSTNGSASELGCSSVNFRTSRNSSVLLADRALSTTATRNTNGNETRNGRTKSEQKKPCKRSARIDNSNISGRGRNKGHTVTTLLLDADEYIPIRYRVSRPIIFSCFVEASEGVNVYLVDEVGYREFENSRPFETHAPIAAKKRHMFKVKLSERGYYWLLISNVTDEVIAVHYRVRYIK